MKSFLLFRWATTAIVVSVTMATTVPLHANPPDRVPEWVIKLNEIAFGDPMKGSTSPLSISKVRFGWPWLAKWHDISESGTISRAQFRGPAELFDRLDRNGDRVLRVADFDWSAGSDFVRQQATTSALFNRINGDGNGAISREEWQAMFTKLAGPSDTLSAEDLHRALFGNPTRPTGSSVNGPTRLMRLRGFLNGELGSWNEGPDPGELAPDFTLQTQDNKTTIQLSQYRGNKPVVLIFGNFT